VLTRIYCAAAVIDATVAAAVWLYTYRVSTVFEYLRPDGLRFHPPERVMVQPWWSSVATVGVSLAGLTACLFLLPDSRGPIQRLAGHLARIVENHEGRRLKQAKPV
jgi:hypothetical protein